MHSRLLTALGVAALLPACSSSPAHSDDFDRVGVPAPRCENGWQRTVLPRNGHGARWALDGSDHWLVSYLADDAQGHPVLRYTSSAQPDAADTLATSADVDFWIAAAPDATPAVIHGAGLTGLAYERRDAHGWHRVPLLGDGSVGTLLAPAPFVIDAAGHTHAVFAANGSGPLYLTDRDGTWAQTPIGATRDATPWNLLADGQGHLHAFFVADEGTSSSEHNRYATNAAGSWQDEPIPGEAWNGPAAIDPQGHVHLVYPAADGVHHLAKLDSGWSDETLPLDAAGFATDLAIDAKGALHVALSVKSGIDYATNRSGSWSTTPVLVGGDANRAYLARVVIDHAGKVRFAYGVAQCQATGPTDPCLKQPYELGTLEACP